MCTFCREIVSITVNPLNYYISVFAVWFGHGNNPHILAAHAGLNCYLYSNSWLQVTNAKSILYDFRFLPTRLALFSSLEMAAGYNRMFADSWVRVLENSLRKVQNTGKWSLSYRITLAIIFTFIPAYHCQARFFAYLLIFTGCRKLSIICRLRCLLTNKRKANHQAHWSAILLLKKIYYWAMCDILLVLMITVLSLQQLSLQDTRKYLNDFSSYVELKLDSE